MEVKITVSLPTDAKERKKYPIGTGVIDYFPDALAEVAHVSYAGNEQHNPGTPLHWDRTKSTDDADALIRHFTQRGTVDSDGVRHSAKMAWRALAILQKEIEADGKNSD
jgi:dATP/dGTP diphosphohydrolase